ncbi:MAG: hypothetical protein V7644_234 [Actinomycetota bacterium]
MPRHAADRTLLAPLADVWSFLADPHNLADWWPGVARVEPDRRGLAPGARWQVLGPDRPSYIRKPQMTGTLVVLEVAPLQRVAFQLTGDRIEAELTLRAEGDDRTVVSLLVQAPFLIGLRRRFPAQALDRLCARVRPREEA